MKLSELVLSNARTFTYDAALRAKGGVGEWMVKKESGNEFLDQLSAQWQPDKFWVPDFLPHGMPLIVARNTDIADRWYEELVSAGVKTSLCKGVSEVSVEIYRSVVVHAGPLGHLPQLSAPDRHPGLVEWLANPINPESDHADAYSKLKLYPLGLTEDVWGMTGADPWAEWRLLVGKLEQTGTYDRRTWDVFWKLVDKGDVSRALDAADNGVNISSSCTVFIRGAQHEKSRPLWDREKRFKKRHHFDVVTLYIQSAAFWEEQGCGECFKRTARGLLMQAVRAGLHYERIYLTMFWAWTSPYWKDISRHLLQYHLLFTTDAEWMAIFKEQTAQVTRTWFFPGTNIQHLCSVYFLNAEDLIGYPDANPEGAHLALDILTFATDKFGYTFPDPSGERTETEYLAKYSLAVEEELKPLY